MGAKAEEFHSSRGVERAAWLSVGLSAVPNDLSLVADFICDKVSEVSNADFLAGTEIDRLGAVISFRRQHNTLGGISNRSDR